MSQRTETSVPKTEEEVEEWLEETKALTERLKHRLNQMKDAKALSIPYHYLSETTKGE